MAEIYENVVLGNIYDQSNNIEMLIILILDFVSLKGSYETDDGAISFHIFTFLL